MPGFQLANPVYFNTGTPLAQGLQGGINAAGEVQRQRQLAAMAPLELQRAQLANAQLAAMTPLQIQEAKLNIAKASMPVPVEEGLTNIPGEERQVSDAGPAWLSADDEANIAKIEQEQGPDAAAAERARLQAMPTTGSEPVQARQLGLYAPNAAGQMERVGQRLIPVETQPAFEERQSLEQGRKQLAEYHAALAQAKDEAAALRAQLIDAQNERYRAQAEKDRATAAAATKNAETNAAKGEKPTGWRVEKDPTDGLWHNVYYSPSGERTVSPGEAATPTANKPGIAEQVSAEVANRTGGGARPTKPAGPTRVDLAAAAAEQAVNAGLKVPGMGAPAEVPAAAEGENVAPVQNPDPATYQSLPPGAPYYWNGVLHHKGQ